MKINHLSIFVMAILAAAPACKFSNIYQDDTLFVRKGQKGYEEKKPADKKQSVAVKPTPTPAAQPKTAATPSTAVKTPIEPVKPQTQAPSGTKSASGATISSASRTGMDQVIRELDRQAPNAQTLANSRGRLETILLQDPKFVEARVNLGIVYEKSGDALRAEESYRQALTDAPSYFPACQHLANLLGGQGRSQRGLEIMKSCIGTDKSDQAGLALAKLYLQQGQTEAALSLLRPAQTKNPEDPAILAAMGEAFLQQGKVAQAKATLQRALPKADSVVQSQILNNLAVCAVKQSEKQEAINLWQEAIAKNPRNLSAYANLGALALEAQDAKRGEQIFKQLCQLDPSNSTNHLNLGIALRLKGDYRGAELEYLRAVKLDPKAPEPYFNLGVLYQKYLKDPEKALIFYRRFGELDPKALQSKAMQELLSDARQEAARKQKKGT